MVSLADHCDEIIRLIDEVLDGGRAGSAVATWEEGRGPVVGAGDDGDVEGSSTGSGAEWMA